MKAIITYRTSTQKITDGFKSNLTPEVLRDICFKLTGQTEYIVKELHDTYNKGRLLTLEYDGMTSFVTLSEKRIAGRNSSMQSVPTALNLFYSSDIRNKQLCYYVLPHEGNAYTDYHLVYYRLMLTAGFRFLNLNEEYSNTLSSYKSVDEIIAERSENQTSNRSNNSSFVSKTQDRIQLYAKTYGANKYESTVIGVALSQIADRPIDIFNVSEQDLVSLPRPSLKTFEQLGNITVYNTSLRLNKSISEADDSLRLRSAAYNFNLLDRIGMKKCVLCNCEIQEIIHGAHIWGVADIKKSGILDDDQKYHHATSGHNGVWLCQNHHKLFDSNLLAFDVEGHCLLKNSLPTSYNSFIRDSINTSNLRGSITSDEFKYYLSQRNQTINLNNYQVI